MQFTKRLFGTFKTSAPATTTSVNVTKEESASKQLGSLAEPPNALSREETLSLIRSFPFWYHRIYVGNGIYTLDNPALHEVVWQKLCPSLPRALDGMSVLDVGCNAGFFSIQLKLLGAGKVVGIESWEDYYKQAEWCKKIWNVDIDYRLQDAHSLDTMQEKFDLVIFAGVLYHLKNPLQVLEQMGRLCEDTIWVETEIIPEDPRNCLYVGQGTYKGIRVTACHKGFMKFIEGDELNGDPSNWWVPDTECVIGMLRTAGFKYFSAPVYVMERRLILIASKKSDSRFNLRALD
ncbi:MAG: DUF1698 domain-containing protein [Chloroflexi bacterium]|nr:DUF1698 domain-containing protein [Chloroflexota bacterium]